MKDDDEDDDDDDDDNDDDVEDDDDDEGEDDEHLNREFPLETWKPGWMARPTAAYIGFTRHPPKPHVPSCTMPIGAMLNANCNAELQYAK